MTAPLRCRCEDRADRDAATVARRRSRSAGISPCRDLRRRCEERGPRRPLLRRAHGDDLAARQHASVERSARGVRRTVAGRWQRRVAPGADRPPKHRDGAGFRVAAGRRIRAPTPSTAALEECATRTSTCIDNWAVRVRRSVLRLRVSCRRSRLRAPRRRLTPFVCCAPLRASLDADARYARVYDGAGASVFRRAQVARLCSSACMSSRRRPELKIIHRTALARGVPVAVVQLAMIFAVLAVLPLVKPVITTSGGTCAPGSWSWNQAFRGMTRSPGAPAAMPGSRTSGCPRLMLLRR